MRIAVVGLGKIGLPLAVQYAGRGHGVVGVDINQAIVDQINSGLEPFPGETDLGSRLADVVARGLLTATRDYGSAVPGADAVIVVVPLVVDDETWEPDFRALDSATASISHHLTAGALVCYETTLPVGTTRARWRPALERGSGLREGADFHVVFSPERVLTGRVFADLRRYPKLVGAFGPGGARRAREFYDAVLDFDPRPDLPRPNGVWDLGTPEAAEMAKLAETTYRDVNIALVNQFAAFAEANGIDITSVIAAANSQPYSHLHRPGVSVGGHCIPVYPRLYLFNDPAATVVRAAREANASMPQDTVARLRRVHGPLEGHVVLILGAAYRGGVKETAFSGVFPLARALSEAGARVVVHDPLYAAEELTRMGLEPYRWGDSVDAAVVHTDHPQYRALLPESLPGVRTVVDGRNILDPEDWTGVRLLRLGVGEAPGSSQEAP